jgi:hypothetical protein
MKKLTCTLMLFLALIASATAGAQTLQEAYADAVAGQTAADAAYSDATNWHGDVSELVAELNALVGDLTEEELGSELYAELSAAWTALQNADSAYNQGCYWMSQADYYWEVYDGAGGEEEQIQALTGVTSACSDACDCLDEAADAYAVLDDELDSLCNAVDERLDALVQESVTAMNDAHAGMAGQKGLAELAYGDAGTACSAADDKHLEAWGYPQGDCAILGNLA